MVVNCSLMSALSASQPELADFQHVVVSTTIFLVILPFVLFDISRFPLGSTAAVLVGSCLMVVGQVLTQDDVYDIVGNKKNLQTIFLLLGMMILAVYFEREKILDNIIALIFRGKRGKFPNQYQFGKKTLSSSENVADNKSDIYLHMKRPGEELNGTDLYKNEHTKVTFVSLLSRVCVITGIMSALFTNDATCAILTPLILDKWKGQKRDKMELKPLVLGIATSANIGSAATIFGNPQIALIASKTSEKEFEASQLNLRRTMKYLFLPAAFGLLVNIGLLLGLFKWREHSKTKQKKKPRFGSCDDVRPSTPENDANSFLKIIKEDKNLSTIDCDNIKVTMESSSTVPETSFQVEGSEDTNTLWKSGVLSKDKNSLESVNVQRPNTFSSHDTTYVCEDFNIEGYRESKFVDVGVCPPNDTNPCSYKMPCSCYKDSCDLCKFQCDDRFYKAPDICHQEESNCGKAEVIFSRKKHSIIPTSNVEDDDACTEMINTFPADGMGYTSDAEVFHSENNGFGDANRCSIKNMKECSNCLISKPVTYTELPSHAILFRPSDSRIFKSYLVIMVLLLIIMLCISTREYTFDLGLIPLAASVLTILFDTIVNKTNSTLVVQRVDWSIILLFFGMFVWLEGFNSTNVPAWIWHKLHFDKNRLQTYNEIFPFVCYITIGSNIFSNVPLVILVLSQLNPCSNNLSLVCILAWASTIAGNLTMFGSVANIIVIEKTKATIGYRLTFWEYLKFGVISTIVVMSIGSAILILLLNMW